MGKKTSAAVGTAAQFMPQPDGVYQERLQGITGVKGSAPDTSSEKMTAESLGGAVGAYLDYSNSHRQKFEAAMDKAAQDMINSASQEAVEALNTTEMSQTYGYGTLVDNPYWRAAVSRKAGERLMTTLDAQYNDLYGDDRSLSMDDERKRYEDFVSSKQEDYLSKLPLDNRVAFMGGFNARKTQSIQTLMDNRSQRDVADRLTETAAAINSDLSEIVADCAGMTVDDVIKKASESTNLSRLANLSPETKYKIISNFVNDITKTGVFTSDEVLQMLDKIPVSTRLDGTTVPMSELIDVNAVREVATAYQASHLTEYSLSVINEYKDCDNIDKVYTDLGKLHASKNPADRRKAEVIEGQLGKISYQINENKQRKLARQKEWAERGEAAAQADADYTLYKANFELAKMGNHDMVDAFNNTEGNVRRRDGTFADKAIGERAFMDEIDSILSDGNLEYAERLRQVANLANYAGMESVMNNYRERIHRQLSQIPKSQLEDGVVEGTYANLYNMFIADRQNFGSAFGSQLMDDFTMIRTLANNSGYEGYAGLAIGINKWQDVSANMTPELKQEYTQQYNSYISSVRSAYGSAPDIAGIDNLSTGGTDTITFDDIALTGIGEKLAVSYMAAGDAPDAAVAQAGNDIRDNYVFKWGTIIPKAVARSVYPEGAPTDSALPLMGYALNTFAADMLHDDAYLSMNAPNNDRVRATYFADTGNIVLRDTYNPAVTRTITTGELAKQMKRLSTQPTPPSNINNGSTAASTVGSPNAYQGDWWSNPDYGRFR